MTNTDAAIAALLGIVPWFAGIVLAQGFWSTAAAILFPPWALYLAVEQAMRLLGWL